MSQLKPIKFALCLETTLPIVSQSWSIIAGISIHWLINWLIIVCLFLDFGTYIKQQPATSMFIEHLPNNLCFFTSSSPWLKLDLLSECSLTKTIYRLIIWIFVQGAKLNLLLFSQIIIHSVQAAASARLIILVIHGNQRLVSETQTSPIPIQHSTFYQTRKSTSSSVHIIVAFVWGIFYLLTQSNKSFLGNQASMLQGLIFVTVQGNQVSSGSPTSLITSHNVCVLIFHIWTFLKCFRCSKVPTSYFCLNILLPIIDVPKLEQYTLYLPL